MRPNESIRRSVCPPSFLARPELRLFCPATEFRPLPAEYTQGKPKSVGQSSDDGTERTGSPPPADTFDFWLAVLVRCSCLFATFRLTPSIASCKSRQSSSVHAFASTGRRSSESRFRSDFRIATRPLRRNRFIQNLSRSSIAARKHTQMMPFVADGPFEVVLMVAREPASARAFSSIAVHDFRPFFTGFGAVSSSQSTSINSQTSCRSSGLSWKLARAAARFEATPKVFATISPMSSVSQDTSNAAAMIRKR